MGANISGGQRYPAEMVQRNQWCLWRIEPDKKGRPTKIPYRPDGRKAASNDPRTWSPYSAVCDVLVGKPGSFRGIGYFFSANDTTCGVDLDVSLDANSNPQPWAAQIISKFPNTYRAFSVSGVGLHILCHAKLPGKGRNFYVPNVPADSPAAATACSDRNRRRISCSRQGYPHRCPEN